MLEAINQNTVAISFEYAKKLRLSPSGITITTESYCPDHPKISDTVLAQLIARSVDTSDLTSYPTNVGNTDEELDRLLATLLNSEIKKKTEELQDCSNTSVFNTGISAPNGKLQHFHLPKQNTPSKMHLSVTVEQLTDQTEKTCIEKVEDAAQDLDITNSVLTTHSSTLHLKLPTFNDKSNVQPVTALKCEYRFPRQILTDWTEFSNEELWSKLNNSYEQGVITKHPLGYDSVRNEICAISIEMNLRHVLAPRFRSTVPLDRKASTTAAKNMALDRQVIDLHWYANSTARSAAAIDDYPSVLNSEPFDYEVASKFALEKWGAPAKSLKLHLSESLQWEGAVIQSEAIRKRWLVIHRGDVRGSLIREYGMPQIKNKLQNAFTRSANPSNSHAVPGMVNVWAAQKIVGDSPSRISKMVAMMTGEPARDERAVARTLKSIGGLLS